MATEQDIYNDINDAQTENDTQAAKIAEAISLLNSKAAGGGGGGEELALLAEGNVVDLLYPTFATADAEEKQYMDIVLDFGDEVYDEFQLYIKNSSATALTVNNTGTAISSVNVTVQAVNYGIVQWSGGAVFSGGVRRYANPSFQHSGSTWATNTWASTYIAAEFLEDLRYKSELKSSGSSNSIIRLIGDDKSGTQYWNKTNGFTGAIALELNSNQFFNPATVATYRLYGRKRNA